MNDQDRLDKIINWMVTVGDPWMKGGTDAQPQPGSDLAADDSDPPASSALSHRVLVMGLDHLGSVVDSMLAGDPKRLNAPFTALRTALMCGTRVCWLLEPDSSPDRQLRAIQYRFENLEEQRKALTDFADTHLTDEQDEGLADSLDAIEVRRQALAKRAIELGAVGLTKPPPTTQMLKDLVDLTTPEGTGMVQLWRTGSASAHGHYWADEIRNNRGAFDFEWFQPAIQGAFLMINDAMNRRHKRATSTSA